MADQGRQGRAQLMWCCSTPKEHCKGKPNGKMGGTFHSSPEQVRSCMAHYLTTVRGYIQRSNREFEEPNGGPILILNKKPTRALAGKNDTTFMNRGRRIRVRLS